MPTKIEQARRFIRKRPLVKTADFTARCIPRVYLRRLVASGDLIQQAPGLYSSPNVDITAQHSLAAVGRVVPKGVVCLLSALAYHELGTQLPHEVWLAIPPSARKPARLPVRLRIVRMSGPALTSGVETHRIEGIPVRIFSAAKTVADCFRFRNKIGIDVAVEALRAYRRRRGNLDELWRFAEICRVARVMRPYLEAVT